MDRRNKSDDPSIAPIRFEQESDLLSNDKDNNTNPANDLKLKIWLKSNDFNRTVNEMNGLLTLTLPRVPADKSTVNFGFFFGAKVATKNKKKTEYSNPLKYEGSFL